MSQRNAVGQAVTQLVQDLLPGWPAEYGRLPTAADGQALRPPMMMVTPITAGPWVDPLDAHATLYVYQVDAIALRLDQAEAATSKIEQAWMAPPIARLEGPGWYEIARAQETTGALPPEGGASVVSVLTRFALVVGRRPAEEIQP